MDDILFRKLSPKEEKDFKAYAHDHWTIGTKPNECWHPVVRTEWGKLGGLSEHINAVYNGLCPDINIDPTQPDAKEATINMLLDYLISSHLWEDHKITTNLVDFYGEPFNNWVNLPECAQKSIVTQTVGQYF